LKGRVSFGPGESNLKLSSLFLFDAPELEESDHDDKFMG
jgi:hypothetical protein